MFSQLHKPNFEQFVKVLFNKKADFIPLIELGIHPNIKKQIMGREIINVEDEILFMKSMGYDFLKLQPSVNFNLNLQSKEKTINNPLNSAVDRAWASAHHGVIKSWKDFEKYIWPKIEEIDYSRFEIANKILPDGMGVIGQYGDIFTVAWEMMGFEDFAISIYEQPDLVEAIYKKVDEIIFSMFENMVEFDCVGALWFSDDIAFASGLLINPDFLKQFFFPTLIRIGDLTKKKNIPFIYHTDGVLWNVFDDIISSGVTAQHPIEPKAMNIKEVKNKVGDKICLCGGIDVDLLSRGTKDEVKNLTLDYLNFFMDKGGWCAGSSNSITEYVKIENYLTMVETVLNFNIM